MNSLEGLLRVINKVLGTALKVFVSIFIICYISLYFTESLTTQDNIERSLMISLKIGSGILTILMFLAWDSVLDLLNSKSDKEE